MNRFGWSDPRIVRERLRQCGWTDLDIVKAMMARSMEHRPQEMYRIYEQYTMGHTDPRSI